MEPDCGGFLSDLSGVSGLRHSQNGFHSVFRGNAIIASELSLKIFFSYVSFTVNREVAYSPR